MDNLSFYSVNDSEVASIAAVAPNSRQRSISNCMVEAPSDILAKELENEPDELKVGKSTKYISCLAVMIAATAVAGRYVVILVIIVEATPSVDAYRTSYLYSSSTSTALHWQAQS